MTDIHTPHDFENRYSPAQLKAIRAEYAPKATDSQWLLFISECVRRNLTPGDHVVFQVRRQNVFDEGLNQWVKESRGTLITTLKALRLLAKRSGNYEGPRRFKYYYLDANGEPTTITEIPLGRIPHAVSIEGFVKGWREPAFGVARYDACVQRKKDGQPNSVWSQRGVRFADTFPGGRNSTATY